MTLDDYVAAVDAVMPLAVEKGVLLLTPFLLGGDGQAHAQTLLDRMGPTPGGRILDAGSGTGELARLMLQVMPDLRFTLLNPSALQLHMGPAQAEKLCAAFEAIPAPDGSYDVVMFSQSIEHAQDVPAVLREAARVLVPDGQVFIFGLRHVSGPRDHMTRLVWSTPLTKSEMIAAGESAGLVCEAAFCPPSAQPMIAPGVLSEADHRLVFGGVEPFVWRLRKVA